MLDKTSESPGSFRKHLQNELMERCRRNRGYSLRAFARALDLSPSSLSRLLSGEREFSNSMKTKIGERLGLAPNQWGAAVDESQPNRKQAFHSLDLDQFAVVADWYHSAILELTALNGFRPEPKWMAQTLGITVLEAKVAVERLLGLGLLKRSKSGKLFVSSGSNTTIDKGVLSTAAQRKLQKQVLELALLALEEIPKEQRSQSSMTMAIHSKMLPEALDRIKRFRREMSKYLEKSVEKNSVYHLSISFYPVTKTIKETRS